MRALTAIGLILCIHCAYAAEKGCGQALVDGTTPPATTAFIAPPHPITPFYQWENNDGYCGEVSMMQGGLAHGQYMSQYNARAICGTGLSQSGPGNACATHANQTNYNAQLLIENPGTGVTGPNTYAYAALCVANSRLAGNNFPYTSQTTGLAGVQQYLSWIKQEVIAGHQVTAAVLINGGTDAQYDHEVGVIKIGTNHAATDPTYYPDDVLYFDDHGAYTLSGKTLANYPSIPRGAGADTTGCTPYIYGYSFASLANTRAGANKNSAQGYSLIIPQNNQIHSYAGGTGYAPVTITGPHNYGFSVAGPADTAGETLPVALQIIGPTETNGRANPLDPVAGYNYENPRIGAAAAGGNGCTNTQPPPMTQLRLQATIGALMPGQAYNLYEYEFAAVTGTSISAGLPVPTADFNANASLATQVTHFTASAATFVASVTTTSDKIVVFRAVPASGP
jgi:hypothetical protein